ncbi:hypothetical protein Droror1_Dr00026308 [Drosera rotundifolia]
MEPLSSPSTHLSPPKLLLTKSLVCTVEKEIELTPKLSKKVYEGDGGSYHAWCPSKPPLLEEGNIGTAKLALEKNGFALPRYSDSAKVAYVLQGYGVAGIVLPEKEEKVIAIKKGNAIALPFGVVTWRYNKNDTELVVLFLGDTSKAHKAGSFTDFFLTGTSGIFNGFSTEFLDGSIKMPEPKDKNREGMALNCKEAPLDVDIKGGGCVVVLNTKNLSLVGEIVGVDGKQKLETTVKAGNLFIVPRFFVVSKIADETGLEWFSIITTPDPIFTHLAGRTSVWKALSPEVLQAAFNVTPEVENQFRLKRTSDAIFFAPS